MKHARSQRVRQSDNRHTVSVLDSGQQKAGQPNVQIAFNPGLTDHRRQTCQHLNSFVSIVIANALEMLAINRHLLDGLATWRITLTHLLDFKAGGTNHEGITRG